MNVPESDVDLVKGCEGKCLERLESLQDSKFLLKSYHAPVIPSPNTFSSQSHQKAYRYLFSIISKNILQYENWQYFKILDRMNDFMPKLCTEQQKKIDINPLFQPFFHDTKQ